MSKRSSRNAGDVCMLCGMCCDGTLFDHAKMVEAEAEHVVSLGLEVRRRDDGSLGFVQPCPAFTNGCCGVYEQRPTVCSSYRCRLLPEYEAGAMSLDDCTDVIESMRSLARHVEENTGLPIGSFTVGALYERLNELRPQDDPEAHQPLLVALDRFQQMAITYFGWRPVPKEVADAAADAAQAVGLP